jgi:hypothetical protein
LKIPRKGGLYEILFWNKFTTTINRLRNFTLMETIHVIKPAQKPKDKINKLQKKGFNLREYAFIMLLNLIYKKEN